MNDDFWRILREFISVNDIIWRIWREFIFTNSLKFAKINSRENFFSNGVGWWMLNRKNLVKAFVAVLIGRGKRPFRYVKQICEITF